MSYQVIARKYRPQTFDDVVGQKLVTDTLKNAILHNRVAHGYIFSGARGVGKTTTARILAKALNCIKGPTATPCGKCPSCQEIAAGNSVDVLEIDAASNRGIDEIRELRETVRYLPARDRMKVFIIDEAHMLTPEAFNALLKTLEEPPPRALFILATTEPHKLPSTIQSRCQHFVFRLLDYGEIYSQLERVVAQEKIKAEEGALGAIAVAAQGSMRDGLSLLDQVIASCGEQLDEKPVRQVLGVVPTELLVEMLSAIHKANAQRVLELVSQVTSEGYELAQFSSEFARTTRNLMVAKTCGPNSPLLQVSKEERKALTQLTELFTEEDLTRFFQILLRVEGEMRYSLEPRFNLELALIKLVHARRLRPLEEVLSQLRGSTALRKPTPETPRGSLPRSDASTGSKGVPGRVTRRTDAAPETPPARSVAAIPAETRAERDPTRVEDKRFDAIKSLLFDRSKKFLSSCLEHASGWRFENGEVCLLYPKQQEWAMGFLKSRDQLDDLRAACSQVLGQPVKICVTLDERAEEKQTVQGGARERAERDPGVNEFLRKFDCIFLDVKDLTQE